MELSSRLKIIASFVSEGMCVADIGTDHGYIPIYLTSEGMTDKAYAMDVNRGPLERASENIRKEGLNGRYPVHPIGRYGETPDGCRQCSDCRNGRRPDGTES